MGGYYEKKHLKIECEVSKDENFITFSFKKPVCLKIPNKSGVLKFIAVLLRLFVDAKGNPIFTYQAISNMLGYNDRRDVHNYFREFVNKGSCFVSFLTRKVELTQYADIIQNFVNENLFLNFSELFELFRSKYPAIKISQPSFYKYVAQTNTCTVLKHFHKWISKKGSNIDCEYLISYIFKNFNEPVIKKKVEDMAVLNKENNPKTDAAKHNFKTTNMIYLVIFLFGSGLSCRLISFLLGISKSYVHKLLHSMQGLGAMLLSSIDKWSGKICVDEKYVKIQGEWRYIFSAVDAVTGVPLLVGYFENKTALSWEVFFAEFKHHYGLPTLIISDGCQALASGRASVFPNVPYQYCKFHKMRNLIKKIYENVNTPEEAMILINKLKQVFSRKLVGNRRKALLELDKMSHGGIKDYLNKRIMKDWKHLTKSLTSNAAERWNRDIKKTVSGRYGFQKPETILLLVQCLWFKKLVMNGKHHLAQDTTIKNLNISKICQELISYKHLEQLLCIDKQQKNVAGI